MVRNINPPGIPVGYELGACVDRFMKWVDEFPHDEGLPWPRDKQVQAMIGELGAKYCEAPASHTHRYHGAFKGGLLIHSTLILDHMVNLLNAWGEQQLATSNSVPFVAYFHDLGKVGDVYGPVYVPQDSDWHAEKLGDMYKYNEAPGHQQMPHEERGAFNLQFFGVPMTREEYVCVLYHGMGYNERAKMLGNDTPPLLLALSYSDLWVSRKYRI